MTAKSAAVLIFAAAAVVVPVLPAQPTTEPVIQDSLEPIREAIELSLANAAYNNEVDEDSLITAALKGIVEALPDPYSSVRETQVPPDTPIHSYAQLPESGLIPGNDEYGRVVVADVLPGSAAERSGVPPGAVILRLGETNTSGMSAWDVLTVLSSFRDAPFDLVVATGGGPPTVLTIVPAPVQSGYVRWEQGSIARGWGPFRRNLRWIQSEAGNVAYVRVTTYAGSTVLEQWDDVAEEIRRAETVRAILLDLRGNGGGSNAAVRTIGDFLLLNEPIVEFESVIGADGWTQRVYNVNPPVSRLLPHRVFILIDRHTASLAEIVTSVLREARAATIIGEPSYGKGTTQTWVAVGDRHAIHMTTARWRTPGGFIVPEDGIQPDVFAVNDPESNEDEGLLAAFAAIRETLAE